MTSTPLPTAPPSAQGVDANGVLAFLDALEAHPDIEPHSVMLLRGGKVVAQGWWAPFSADRVHLLYSLSKTFTASALGFAVAEGLVGLDDAVVDHFPEFAREIRGRSRRILVRHAAAMATGHHGEMAEVAQRTDPREPVRGFLLHEPESEPGTRFAYNQPATYCVAAIVQRAAGTTLLEYLRPRLLDPLGIGPSSWQQHPPGRDLGFTGLHATTDAIARLGQLYLQDGVWHGEQLLPAGWAEQVRTKHVETPSEPNIDWRQGYGFQVWQARHGYRGDGAFGQFCVILPEYDAVLATTMSTESMQAVLDAAWEHLLPALGGGNPSAEADAALAERLAGLALPPLEGAQDPGRADAGGADAGGPDAGRAASEAGGAGAAGTWGGTYRASGPADSAAGVPAVAELERDGDGWTVVLHDGVLTVRLPVPGGTWRVAEGRDGVPTVATSGGWSGGVLRVDALLLETPHRLQVALHPDRRLVTRWVNAPLGGAFGALLRDLQAPRPLG